MRHDLDEGPSPEDIERFSHGGGYCPDCGAEVFDDADVCPSCGTWITGDVLSEPPEAREIRGRVRLVVVLATLFAFLTVLGLMRWVF